MKNCFPIRMKTLFKTYGFVGLLFALPAIAGCSSDTKGPVMALEPLPYAEDALEPYISAKTMNVHYHGHYAGYVSRADQLLQTCRIKEKTLEGVVRAASASPQNRAMFANAAQAWNHAFFWKCLKPEGNEPPQGRLKQMIDDSFGNMDACKAMLVESAGTIVGSGWIWIIQAGDDLKIITTANADTPIAHGEKPIFAIDVWEHAYYLDYQNKRAEYVAAILDHIVNWEFVASRLD
ncbi:MAG: superoxide dismutase [Pseudomonadota bacterium]